VVYNVVDDVTCRACGTTIDFITVIRATRIDSPSQMYLCLSVCLSVCVSVRVEYDNRIHRNHLRVDIGRYGDFT